MDLALISTLAASHTLWYGILSTPLFSKHDITSVLLVLWFKNN